MNAGRLALQKATQRRCKCHGVSGSCSTQTCWVQLGSLEDAGRVVKEQYRKALQLRGGNALLSKEPPCPDARCKDSRERSSHPKDISVTVRPQQLVFLEDSVDFCVATTEEGRRGTEGRECSRSKDPEVSPEERRSCQTLCRSCGLCVNHHTLEVTKSCNCKFVWCCRVKCDSCVEDQKKYWCSRD
ncbi:protein Wnt-8a-like [Oratosquilla oratoria]|uniref:protein Wnt-8a-like n=1 Tax=Oratosquilla oratoria TaxID=337810 RepID=UPI003F75D657